MTNIANERLAFFWGSAPPIVSTNLLDSVNQYDWHYILTIDQPHPASDDWLTRLGDEINKCELFRHSIRITPEPPGWLPIRHRDKNGTEVLSILIAVPPGALRTSLSAYEGPRPVFERAARIVFVAPQMRLRLGTLMQVESLLKDIDLSTVEFTTAFVREHHETWDSDRAGNQSRIVASGVEHDRPDSLLASEL